MKNPSRCIFLALVFTRCKGTLDRFPFDWTIGAGDVLLPNPGVENQRQSWDALGSFSGNPDYLSSLPLAISRVEPVNTAGGVPVTMTDSRVSNPHLENTYETRERPTTHANGPLADPEYNNDISIQQFPVGLAPPSTHMMRSPISISSFPGNLHYTYASQELSKTSTGGDLTTRGQVNDQDTLPKDPYEAQEPAIPFTPMFSWHGLSIPDIPIEVYEKRFINELRSKRARDLVVHSTSGLLPGNKRQAKFEGYFKGKHAMYRQDITSDWFNAPNMITTIFPKPGNVDVTVDKHQLFESAFKIFELRAPQIPNAARTKYPSFIWECVDHWLCALFSHSVTTLSEKAAGKKVLME
ncbi:uncharacterized protein PGTG_04866 [Puccinia graminis f. sp. tritici CRL 75-36-700-3]|uniref:Uncharacterized protein n=1 Tax=Puccinia graminis f. sp. tritici (strain CRL 75-36-700-3 / race SCCL) TaxID=418459 RepID=E3K353_PUCGT|nr:uncharacterized protein PGTG_04866 [Puccinia graminis f. sp. tritici CRL 75-36-700-3]EFP78910.2 hypothetical protein PGTG_04866 [Puccinia graminis f. sp. tritici CRL 75-36-700-3]